VPALAGGNLRRRMPAMQTRHPHEAPAVVHQRRFDARGRPVGEFPEVHRRGDRRRVRIPDGVAFLAHPLPSNDLVAVAPDGSAVVCVRRPVATDDETARFRVLRLGPSGDTAYDRSYTYRPRRVPAAASDSLLAGHVSLIAPRVGGAEAERLVRSAGLIPSHVPGVSDVLAATDGAVWIAREEFGLRSVAWFRLDPRGEVGARIEVPRNVRLRVASGDRLWGVETGEWGEEYVVRYRVAR
jgi:hypothetical protein